MVSAGSYLLSAAAAGRASPSRWASAPSACAGRLMPGLGRRPGPPGRGDRRRRPAHLDRRDPRHLRALLYAWTCLRRASSAASWRCAPAVAPGAGVRRGASAPSDHRQDPRRRTRRPSGWRLLITVGVIALVVAHWGADHEARAGPRHLQLRLALVPHAVRGRHGPEPLGDRDAPRRDGLHQLVLPAELRASARGRDPARRSATRCRLFLNFGWLAIAFLAAWCIGRPYGRGHLSVAAVAILLECHTLVVREPGAAKNDLVAAALLLAAIAILVNAWAAAAARRGGRMPSLPRLAAGCGRARRRAWRRGRS